MFREHAIELEGTVVERLSHRAVRVELANGHRLVAFVSRRDQLRGPSLVCGARLTVEVSPCDFSAGRVRARTERN